MATANELMDAITSEQAAKAETMAEAGCAHAKANLYNALARLTNAAMVIVSAAAFLAYLRWGWTS